MLARSRPTIPGHEVRTEWSKEHDAWICTHRLPGGEEVSERLPVADKNDAYEVQLLELRSINTCAPLVAYSLEECNGEPRVFVDDGGWWSAWIPCNRCDGFPWRIQIRQGGIFAGDFSREVETELARMLAHRVLFHHGRSRPAEECAGCIQREIESEESSLLDGEFAWFSVRDQEWRIRLHVAGDSFASLPLSLPPWASPEQIQEAISRAQGERGPYNQEEDNGFPL